MTRMEIVMECNNYSGIPSEERCHTIEDYVREKIQQKCSLDNIKMNETQIQDNLIQPTLILRYKDGNAKLLIEDLDKILLDIGITAVKAVISRIATRAAEAALAGGGLGLVAGSRSGSAALAATLIGALIGGIIGDSIERRVTELVAVKERGAWIYEEILTARSN